jgi:hypothetical protein
VATNKKRRQVVLHDHGETKRQVEGDVAENAHGIIAVPPHGQDGRPSPTSRPACPGRPVGSRLPGAKRKRTMWQYRACYRQRQRPRARRRSVEPLRTLPDHSHRFEQLAPPGNRPCRTRRGSGKAVVRLGTIRWPTIWTGCWPTIRRLRRKPRWTRRSPCRA